MHERAFVLTSEAGGRLAESAKEGPGERSAVVRHCSRVFPASGTYGFCFVPESQVDNGIEWPFFVNLLSI
jgi:hypothetical protein